jgi:hypothetical protein
MNITTSLNKAFWAFLLNAAVNNLETVVSFLNDKSTVKKNSGIYETLRDANFPEAKKQRLVRQLLKCLPFLNAIRETVEQATRKGKDDNGKPLDYWDVEQRELKAADYADILEYYGKLLTELRNFYTHIDHDAVKFAAPSLPASSVKRYQLNILHVLTAALRETKRRFNYPAPQENNNVDELLHLRRYNGVDRATEQEYKAFQKRREEGKLDLLEMPVFGGNGRYSKMKDNPNCKFFEKKETDYVFTERGFAFFVSWFLQPDEIDKMFQVIKPTAAEVDRRTKKFTASKRTFGVFHIKLPRTRIESVEKMTPDTLGMDIIAELHKCPVTVYDYLTRQDAQRVKDKANKNAAAIEAAQGTPQASDNEDETADTDYSGRRAKNRFAYLALSYLDISEAFDKIRFHIDWGNYVFDCYPKKTIDGATYPDRRLQKRIYSNERMQDAYKWFGENRRNEELQPPYKETTDEISLTQFRIPMVPQYNICRKKNHIGIAFETVPQPRFTGKTTKRRKPDAFINLTMLPALVFLAAHKHGEQAQNVLADYHNNWRKFLQDVRDGKKITQADLPKYGLALDNIPAEFRSYILTGKAAAAKESQQKKSKLGEILEKTQRVQKSFLQESKTDFKPGDKRKRRWKNGDVGLFLARDLVKLQRPNHNKPHQGKITSVNFDAMQAAIATFGASKGTLRDIFDKAGLINNPDYPHPFLDKLVDARGVKALTLQSFFKNYLAAKVQYIKNCQSGKETTYLLDSLQRRIKRKQTGNYIQQLAETYLNEPTVLPKELLDGIVADFVKKECPEKFEQKEKELGKKNKGMNATFLMMRYHQWKYGDASQWFYSLPHGIDSEMLKKITGILKVKTNRGKNTNNVGMPDVKQQELYDRWAKITQTERSGKKPVLLIELNKIRKEFQKNCKGAVQARGETVDYRVKFNQRANRIQRKEEKAPQLKLQDVVLFHAACKLLQLEGLAKLGDIQENKPYLLGQNERKLSRTFEIPATAKRNEKKPLKATITGTMKIKDSGNFNRMINDPRTPSIIRLHLAATKSGICSETEYPVSIDYEHLRQELAMFDRKRVEAFRWVHDFENEVRKQYPAECKAKRRNGYVNFLAYCEVLIEQGEMSKGEALALMQFRNGFSHNYLPEFVYKTQNELLPQENVEAEALFNKLRQQLIGSPLREGETMTERVLNIWQDILRKERDMQRSGISR